MTALKGITPTPAQLASAYKEVFGDVIGAAGGKDGRISRASAERVADRGDAGKLVSDNLINYLDKTKQKSVGANKFLDVVAAYVEREAADVAGPNQRLSLLEIRNLPTDLQAEAFHLRGKDKLDMFPTVQFDENGVYAMINTWVPEQTITTGTASSDGTNVTISGLNDVGPELQPIAQELLEGLWDSVFTYRSENGSSVSIGGAGELGFGPAVDKDTGKAGVLVHWKDIDDNSSVWFFEKKGDQYVQQHKVHVG